MITMLRILSLLVCAHLVAWTATFLIVVGFSPEVAFDYFSDAWAFSAGELPSLVWLYSWGVFVVLLCAFFAGRRLFSRRPADA